MKKKKEKIPAREHNGTGKLSYLAQQVSQVTSPEPTCPPHLAAPVTLSPRPATHTRRTLLGVCRGEIWVVTTSTTTF